MKVYINDDEFMLYRMATEPHWKGQPASEISADDYAKYEQIMDDLFEWQKRIESLPRSPPDLPDPRQDKPTDGV